MCLTRCLNRKIVQLNGEIWKLGNILADRAGPEREKKPEVTRSKTGNRPFLKQPAITPGPFDGKTSCSDHVVKLVIILELNGSVNKSVLAFYLAASKSASAQAFLGN